MIRLASRQYVRQLSWDVVLYGFLVTLLLPAGQVLCDAPDRARDLGIPFDGCHGVNNAITDVCGVLVGQETVCKDFEGEPLARTGVTVVLPRGLPERSYFAAVHRHSGYGELTGFHVIEETGYLDSPILITNTTAVGRVHEAVIRWSRKNWGKEATVKSPVVAETDDSRLNDMYGFHVKRQTVFRALTNARTGHVREGNVGGGTGMISHGFKGGIGTASRILCDEYGGYRVGVLVQANHGDRKDLRIAGMPVGRMIEGAKLKMKESRSTRKERQGSLIVVVAVDAPLLPNQLKRLLKRVPMGLGRTGAHSEVGSGEIFLAFSTVEIEGDNTEFRATFLDEALLTELYRATIQATEEAVINALVAAKTMPGFGGTAHQIPHGKLRELFAADKKQGAADLKARP